MGKWESKTSSNYKAKFHWYHNRGLQVSFAGVKGDILPVNKVFWEWSQQ
jgi:hypothetical protein